MLSFPFLELIKNQMGGICIINIISGIKLENDNRPKDTWEEGKDKK